MSATRAVALDPFALMGVLNVTPDSFSDGGAHAAAPDAIERGRQLVADGATIIDVGGESTRPGAARVGAEEQRRRVVPVIRALRAERADVAITIDTTLAEVAAAALDAGADAVNDVSAGVEDDAMFRLVASRRAGIVLMHRLLPPEADRYSTAHARSLFGGDAPREVAEWLVGRTRAALDHGIERDAIALDPGLGFGKTVDENWALLARVDELVACGFPVVIGASRKSFVGHATGVKEPAQRVVGSVAAAVIAWRGGARIVRTHDVSATRQGLSVAVAASRQARQA
ncbi:MAG: dihydropteroate synthase [Phycisphaerales bacterium]